MGDTVTTSELAFLPAASGDPAFAADVDTAVRPSSPRDPVVYEYWWSQPDENWVLNRFIVTRGGRRIGYATAEHARWEVQPERYGTVEKRGYKEDRRSRRWELDLVAGREKLLAMVEVSRERMRSEGVRLLTLAEDDDPAVIEKVWRLSEEAGDDVPTTEPRVPEEMASYTRWVNAPEIHRDRFWLARIGEAVVGLSVLGYPPVRGVVGTEWTATARSVRGRGVARALKCETVAQAIGLGVDRVRTGNDAANDPILHINETMGYQLIPGGIHYLRPV